MPEISSIASATLNSWFSSKPTFSLMGEYSAGKSTLLNLLLGREVLPTRVTATNMPPIWLTYGPKMTAQTLSKDGTLRTIAIEDLREECDKNTLLVRMTLPSSILKRADIVDTPGISDPRMSLETVRSLGPYLDFVVWCSGANQAWRQTEQAMWASMPSDLYQTSILVLTRADTLRKERDLQKVLKRCTTEADRKFAGFVPLATMKALSAKAADGTVSDEDTWNASHAPAFYEMLKKAISDAVMACSARKELPLPAQPVMAPVAAPIEKVTPLTPPPPVPTPVEPETAVAEPEDVAPAEVDDIVAVTADETVDVSPPKDAETQDAGDAESAPISPQTRDAVLARLKSMAINVENTPLNQHDLSEIGHLSDMILEENKLSAAHRLVIKRVLATDQAARLPRKPVLVQMVREFEDFTDNHRCKLGQTH